MSATLLADIGGSKSRFALASSAGWPERILVIHNDTVADLEETVRLSKVRYQGGTTTYLEVLDGQRHHLGQEFDVD